MRIVFHVLCCVSALPLLLACSNGPPDPDAGVDADADGDDDGDGDIQIDPPAPPVLTPCPEGWEEVPPEDESGVTTCDPWPEEDPVTLPQMTPCPPGWRELPPEEEGGVTTCDPWPEGGAQECDIDEAHFPGEPGCTLIGTPCPEGDWAEDLPAGVPILYVRAGEAAGGDGSQALPFGSIGEAMDAASPGTTIAVSRGTFDEEVEVRREVTLWGACVAETLITNTIPGTSDATVTLQSRDTVVRNLRISGRLRGAKVTGDDASALFVDVVVESATVIGVVVDGSNATLRNVVVRDTRSDESDLTGGVGLRLYDGAQVEVSRAAFERNMTFGVGASEPDTCLTMEDFVVRDTQSQESDHVLGDGLIALAGAQVEISRAVFEQNTGGGVMALENGTSLMMTDMVVRDTQSQESDLTGGMGLDLGEGAIAVVSRAVFERNRTAGVAVSDQGTSLTMEDVIVRDTQSRESDREWGGGLTVTQGAQVEVSHAVFARNRKDGVAATFEGTSLTMTDVVVRDTQSQESNREWGRGLFVAEGAHLEISRAVFERNRSIAVLAAAEGTSLTMTDVVVRDTQSQESDLSLGSGLYVSDGAQVEVTHAVFERNRNVGVAVAFEGTSLTMTDVVVRDTQSQESDLRTGAGLEAVEGAQLEVSRAVFERNRDVGVLVFGDGTELTMRDAIVRETLERECVLDTCAGYGAGIGVGSLGGALIDVTRFTVSDNALCGVQVAFGWYWDGELEVPFDVGGTIDLHDGRVVDNPIGANVQVDDFDIERLRDNVLWDNFDFDIDTSEIYVPTASNPLDELP